MSDMLTQSNLSQILERVAAIQKSIALDGLGAVREAYAWAPLDPPSANCPFFVNQVMPSPVSSVTPGLYWPVSEIDMILAVSRWEDDATFSQNMKNVVRWRDLVFIKFGAHARLSPPSDPGVPDFDFIVDAWITNWSGVPNRVAWGTAEFATLTFRLRVREYLFTPVTA